MTMPIDLMLVRHGESEGNVANKRSRAGDHSAFTEEFRRRPNAAWRLTARGQQQARAAGEWIRANITPGRLPEAQIFDRHYTSEYVRAMETVGHLALPHATWYLESYLRERDWGALDVMPQEERLERYAEEMARRERDGFFYAPPGGESMAALCLRVDRVLATLHRECGDMRVCIVCHGETMLAFRVRLERMTKRRYAELRSRRDPRDEIHNCQVIHFSRRDPVTRKMSSSCRWVRSVCPWDPKRSRSDWETIERPRFSDVDLLAEVEAFPRLVDNAPEPE